MTFYEAALRVLEAAGHPLHFTEITQKSIAQNLLSHVGKTPEKTMLSRLAAMARRTRDRRVIVTAKDTFGLVDWAVPEDAVALAETGGDEANPEDALPPLRPPERHPEPRAENVRAVGRGVERKRRDEDDKRGKRRRYPPIAEVVFEILSEATEPLAPAELADRAKQRELASDELGNDQILTALLEDNQRRIDAGRRPQFILEKATGKVGLERAGSPSEAPPLDLQAAFAEALGIPLEGGRPVLRGLQAQSPIEAPPLDGLLHAAKSAAKEARRCAAKWIRRKLAELDTGTYEKVVVRMLHGLGYREVKIAKRSKEGPLFTARRREGSLDLRFAIRAVYGNVQIDRSAVSDLKRDVSNYSAHLGIVVCVGEPKGDARAEAQGTGALIFLWCAEGLADKFFEARTGVKVTELEVFEVDDAFFETAKVDAEDSRRRREERQRDRDARDRDRPRPPPAAAAPPADSVASAVAAPALESELLVPPANLPGPPEVEPPEVSEEGDEDGDEEDADLHAAAEYVAGARPEPRREGAGAAGQEADRRRRRRRRRGRRGRGQRPAPGAPGEAVSAGAAPEPAPVEQPPNRAQADGGGGGDQV